MAREPNIIPFQEGAPPDNLEVEEIENIQKDFIKSKYYECVKDKVPSVVIHAAKTRLGWNETNRIDVTSGDKAINMPVITFVETETE